MFYIINRILNFCHKSHSFSLVELAVVLSVAGILIGGGLTAYKSTNPKIKSDLKKMQAIEEALQQFFNTNGRLPFPAHPQKGPADADYLQAITTVYNAAGERFICTRTNSYYEGDKTTDGNAPYAYCVAKATKCCPGDFVLWGVVPTRTLRLPDDYAYDSYGHNFEYITHSALAWEYGTLFDDSFSKANYATNQSGTYNVLFKHSTFPDIYVSLDRLYVYNNATNQQIVTTDKNTAYVLISKGNTNKCYFNTKTGTPETTKPTGNLLKNCVQNYRNNSHVDRTIYQGYSKSFNNIVKYKTVSELISTASKVEEMAKNLGSGLTSTANTANKKAICEAMYPVGSVYMNAKDSTNPQTLLGCGTWQAVTSNNYLISANPSNNSTDYDAYNNAYGNFADTYLNECLPNITGCFHSTTEKQYWFEPYGAFYRESLSGDGVDGGNGHFDRMCINASRSNSIYRDNCNAVRPKSYGVYMWVRTS